MHIISTSKVEINKMRELVSSSIKCFKEAPMKNENEETVPRIGAFELFTLFTADIIRIKKIFTR